MPTRLGTEDQAADRKDDKPLPTMPITVLNAYSDTGIVTNDIVSHMPIYLQLGLAM